MEKGAGFFYFVVDTCVSEDLCSNRRVIQNADGNYMKADG